MNQVRAVSNKNIRMTFICDQDWYGMSPTEKGRHCTLCKKEVFDFTGESTESIKDISRKNGGSLCGRFTAEQVDTTLIKPIGTPKSVRNWALVSTLVLSLFSRNAHSRPYPKAQTEQLMHIPAGHGEYPVEINRDSVPAKTEKKDRVKKPFLTTGKRKFYFTKRFPFIRSVRVRLMGAFHF